MPISPIIPIIATDYCHEGERLAEEEQGRGDAAEHEGEADENQYHLLPVIEEQKQDNQYQENGERNELQQVGYGIITKLVFACPAHLVAFGKRNGFYFLLNGRFHLSRCTFVEVGVRVAFGFDGTAPVHAVHHVFFPVRPHGFRYAAQGHASE